MSISFLVSPWAQLGKIAEDNVVSLQIVTGPGREALRTLEIVRFPQVFLNTRTPFPPKSGFRTPKLPVAKQLTRGAHVFFVIRSFRREILSRKEHGGWRMDTQIEQIVASTSLLKY